MEAKPILAVEHLTVAYETERGWLDVVRDVSLQIAPEEKYGLVGESGSGKTTLAMAVVRYLAQNGRMRAGRVLLGGVDLSALSMDELRGVWGGQIGMVTQNPATALNPALRVGDQLAEVARVHLNLPGARGQAMALEMLARVRMPDPASVARRYPHELSGGMLQRALIAMALTSSPRLLILDEPTTALDVTTEAAVLDLIKGLAGESHSAILYITHNLGVVARLCDRVGVMYAGELVEEGPVGDIFHRPAHPYTRDLLACVPRLDAGKQVRAIRSIRGTVPRPSDLPPGCAYAPRCDLAEDACRAARPERREVGQERTSACRRWDETSKEGGSPTVPTGASCQLTRTPLLTVHGLRKYFPTRSSVPWRPGKPVKAVDGVDLEIMQGLTLGLVGESGCGKTTIGRCIVGLTEPTAGEVRLAGETLAPTLTSRPLSTVRRLQMVFQHPDASLNPRMTVGEILARPLLRLGGLRRAAVPERVAELLRAVSLPEDYASRLPEELSGGEKQRVAIARAFAADPDAIVADEPLSALDVSVQGALINLLNDLQASRGTSYLFISHDLAAVHHMSDFIAVLYLGKLWETGSADEVFSPPYHPYTEALLSAIPVPDPDVEQAHIRLEGTVPSPIDPPSGCTFHTRCPRKLGEICERELPPWRQASPTHRICCHRELDELRRLQPPAIAAEHRYSGGG